MKKFHPLLAVLVILAAGALLTFATGNPLYFIVCVVLLVSAWFVVHTLEAKRREINRRERQELARQRREQTEARRKEARERAAARRAEQKRQAATLTRPQEVRVTEELEDIPPRSLPEPNQSQAPNTRGKPTAKQRQTGLENS